MTILITGVCGFVGSSLARALREMSSANHILGIDNLSRPGSEINRSALRKLGMRLIHGDVRCTSDFENLPDAEWVIDAAADPSVLAGLSGSTSRRLVEQNVLGTMNVLEYCRQRRAGLIFLSTSRVYSTPELRQVPLQVRDCAFHPVMETNAEAGWSDHGICEAFPTTPPLSLYGATKLASEQIALEYSNAFGFPVWINRCGVLSGAGQFGRADQGIFSFWIHSYRARRPLAYIGFDGCGHQVRDCLHPRDLAALIAKQLIERGMDKRLDPINVGGGCDNSMSLAQLTTWCTERFGPHQIDTIAAERPFDVPWLVLDCRHARAKWGWDPRIRLEQVLEEIALHAEANPEWLDQTSE